jgi:peptidoglycan/xylan/chitin deacetylase (PgdA/CDA1 family)
VNDDRDPFFPAISSSLFAQEMRHLARHYKVVSMPNLVKHLEGGPPEPVLAITFDDGYRDNYENAFPILQRFGLPSTIFLTTGTMDYDDPIWFEQLAHALKKTTLEHLDLEIDIPRRFFLHTQEERLRANNRIFGLLRDLPDTERTQWLPRILHQLGVADNGERHGKMLTWDQARYMSTRGVGFGGHTVNHPFLSRLTRENACWEASECKRRIETELQLPVECFAYPNGREKDLGPWSNEVILSAGYRAAVTTIWGMNYSSTDRMQLKRGGPWEESQALFSYKLDWYQLVDG